MSAAVAPAETSAGPVRWRPMVFEAMAVLTLYLILAGLETWPLALHLHDRVLGLTGFENTPQTLWLCEEWKSYTVAGARDLLGASPAGVGAFAWNELSFASKVSMANGVDFIPTLLLDAIFGFPAYYNVKCLLILASNALGMYLLLRGLAAGRVAAFMGGAVFSLNPFVIYELVTGRIVETILLPLPLYVLCLWKIWHRLDEPPGVRTAWAVGGGLALGASTLVYWFDGWFLFIFTVVFLAYELGRDTWRRRLGECRARLVPLALVPLVALPLILPAALPYLVKLSHGDRIPGMVRMDGDGDDAMQAFTTQLVTWSCQADYPFRSPAVGRPHSPPWNLPGMMRFSGVFTLAGILSLLFLPAAAKKTRAPTSFWIAAFVLLYLLPLGPYLCLDGRFVQLGGQDVALPYNWLVRHLPLLDKLFFPNQIMVLWVLACCVVIGLALSTVRNPRIALLVGLALLAAGAVEMRRAGILPVLWSPVVVPAPYVEARTRPEDGFIYVPVNLKFWERSGRNDREFYNGTDLTHVDYHIAMHGRKSLWGRNQYLAGDSSWMFDPRSAMSNSFLRFLIEIDRGEKPYEADDGRHVYDNGFRNIVLLERLCSHPPARGGYVTRLEEGRALYDVIRGRLEGRLGAPVYEGEDPSWDRWIIEDGVVLHTYRMAIFRISAGRQPK